MASSVTSVPRQEVNALLRQVQGNSLFNRQLSSVCQVNGLKSTGVKAELQRRIIDLIQETVNLNDVSRFHQVRQSIANAVAQRPSPSKTPIRTPLSSQPSTLPSSMSQLNAGKYGTKGDLGSGLANGHRIPSSHATSTTSSLQFHPSPFYHIEAPIGSVRVLDAMAQHRNSVPTPIKLSDYPMLQRCLDDKNYRIMVFCAGDSTGVQDIAFPHQSEIKVNNDDVKANLRGLKNKPGSTRPADITNALRLRSNYMNKVDFTYALTNKKFYLLINLCKTTPVSELVAKVSTRRKIPKESVVAELNSKAQDPDVVATSQVLNLKCPLSCMRLEVPCRGLSCTHVQCFDATSYLQLQEQGPQWLCPICNKSAPFEQLAVDEYVRDILEKTPKSLEKVTIEPNGRWSTGSSPQERPVISNGTSLDDDDDDDDDNGGVDDFQVSEIDARGSNTPKILTPSTSTPGSGGRGSSSGALRPGSSAKRPAPVVIDLTLSSDDDEDDEVILRPNKRQKYRSSAFGFDSSRIFPP